MIWSRTDKHTQRERQTRSSFSFDHARRRSRNSATCEFYAEQTFQEPGTTVSQRLHERLPTLSRDLQAPFRERRQCQLALTPSQVLNVRSVSRYATAAVKLRREWSICRFVWESCWRPRNADTLFHWQILQESCNKAVIKSPTIPYTRRYTTL